MSRHLHINLPGEDASIPLESTPYDPTVFVLGLITAVATVEYADTTKRVEPKLYVFHGLDPQHAQRRFGLPPIELSGTCSLLQATWTTTLEDDETLDDYSITAVVDDFDPQRATFVIAHRTNLLARDTPGIMQAVSLDRHANTVEYYVRSIGEHPWICEFDAVVDIVCSRLSTAVNRYMDSKELNRPPRYF